MGKVLRMKVSHGGCERTLAIECAKTAFRRANHEVSKLIAAVLVSLQRDTGGVDVLPKEFNWAAFDKSESDLERLIQAGKYDEVPEQARQYAMRARRYCRAWRDKLQGENK